MAQVDLVNQIEFRSLECLNASPSHGADNALKQVLHLVHAHLLFAQAEIIARAFIQLGMLVASRH